LNPLLGVNSLLQRNNMPVVLNDFFKTSLDFNILDMTSKNMTRIYPISGTYCDNAIFKKGQFKSIRLGMWLSGTACAWLLKAKYSIPNTKLII
jgi:hypothetical protein